MSTFTDALDEDGIVAAIAAAEMRTSGEIRVLIANGKAEDPVATATSHFERLGMTQTAERNGVLIFIAPASHTFAIIGDTGIHEKCGQSFWQHVTDIMTEQFRRGAFQEGVALAIARAGELLAAHFPRRPDDRNELPNEVERA